MLALLVFGPPVERVLGHRKTLVLYGVAHLIGCLCEFLLDSNSTVRTIGASGAIAGLMGAYGYVFRHERTDFSVSLFFLRLWTTEVSVLFTLFLWAIGQSGLWLISSAAGMTPAIAYGAHVEGFIVGLAFGYGVSKRREELLARWRREHAPDIPCAACGGAARFAVDDLYRCRACGKWIHGPEPASGAWRIESWRRR